MTSTHKPSSVEAGVIAFGGGRDGHAELMEVVQAELGVQLKISVAGQDIVSLCAQKNVSARASGQHVGARPAIKQVVIIQAAKKIITVIAENLIRAAAAGNKVPTRTAVQIVALQRAAYV